MAPEAEIKAAQAHSAAQSRAGGMTAQRLVSVDAYRGFVMLLMASDGLRLSRIAAQMPDSGVWHFVGYQTEHTAWGGCSLWDLIQPSFTFLVGVSLPFSLAKRRAGGQGFGMMLGHAIWRAAALTFLGVFLRSLNHQQTYFTFEDTLSQIGMGYVFLFLLAWTTCKMQTGVLAAILVGYWAAFALYPLPGAGFDFRAAGVPENWRHLSGFAAHWDMNTNLGAAVDRWFLNLFPREKPFIGNGGGYLTLSFVPTLGTMILGLLAGEFLRRERSHARKAAVLAAAGIAGLAAGTLLDATGICPCVKRIWTPSWVLFSGGWVSLLLAFFMTTIDWKGWRGWTFPLVVVGMNSIAMYVMDGMFAGPIRHTVPIFLGRRVYEIFGNMWAPATEMGCVLLVLWLICYWMYRRKLFLKI